jgi:AraC family ethanolamine operon transcriptional activator
MLVTDLVQAAGVSQRSLETAFRERFGMGPKRYLLSRRLEGVRRRLLRSSPGERIADIAREWGFVHASQFATDYRLWFGELPSETMARRV